MTKSSPSRRIRPRSTIASSRTHAATRSMSGSSLQTEPESTPVGPRLAFAAAYAVLGAALLWSRLVHLGHSFWTDEILMVTEYVREGPREILAGPDLTHELMAVLAWATSNVAGESEIAFRLWSVVPFVAGVTIVTAWLHSRLDPLSGVLFLFLSTVSPLLLDITRQARGYGLAFAAMSILVVAALEASRTARTSAIVTMCVAGVVGTWTCPSSGLPSRRPALLFSSCERFDVGPSPASSSPERRSSGGTRLTSARFAPRQRSRTACRSASHGS